MTNHVKIALLQLKKLKIKNKIDDKSKTDIITKDINFLMAREVGGVRVG